jgi:hypothetical protein
MSAKRNIPGPVQEGDEFDWRWVGEPESWMGLRSERSLTKRPVVALSKSEPQSGRLAARLVQSLIALLRR